MTPSQIERATALHDRLLEAAMIDADPASWTAAGIKPKDMTKEERGDAKWCRNIAISTVALTMSVQRLLQNQVLGGAPVPDRPDDEPVEDEIARYEAAAGQVLDRMRRDGTAKR